METQRRAQIVQILCGTLLALALLTVPRTARAASVVPFSFESTEDCGSTEEFLRLFQTRLTAVRLIPADEERALVRARVTDREASYEATLSILLRDSGTLTRTLTAPTCAEALDALAFVTAIALDPKAPEPLSLRPAPEPEPARKPIPAQHRPRPRSWIFSVDLQGTGVSGTAPGWLAGGRFFGAVRAKEPGLWSPSARIGAGYLLRHGHQTEEGIADFTLLVGAMHLCPSRAAFGPLSVRPCALLGAGTLHAQGRDTFQQTEARRPWFASGGAVLLSAALSRRVSLTGDAEAGILWVRDRFLLGGEEFYRQGPAFLSLSAGMEVRFGDR